MFCSGAISARASINNECKSKNVSLPACNSICLSSLRLHRPPKPYRIGSDRIGSYRWHQVIFLSPRKESEIRTWAWERPETETEIGLLRQYLSKRASERASERACSETSKPIALVMIAWIVSRMLGKFFAPKSSLACSFVAVIWALLFERLLAFKIKSAHTHKNHNMSQQRPWHWNYKSKLSTFGAIFLVAKRQPKLADIKSQILIEWWPKTTGCVTSSCGRLVHYRLTFSTYLVQAQTPPSWLRATRCGAMRFAKKIEFKVLSPSWSL